MKKKNKYFVGFKIFMSLAVLAAILFFSYQLYYKMFKEKDVLRQIISRLQADSRVAEVVVTDVSFNPLINKHLTTIKFLEYDSNGRPLSPRYFTFSKNLIQFQSLVVRFEDRFITAGDALRGKSVFLFWKAFMLDGEYTEEYAITPVNQIPEGYKVDGASNQFEEKIWTQFWEYALHQDKAVTRGIKNAQVEAPGTKFMPGFLYTLKIEHDGGIRIDVSPIPDVLKGEKVL